MKEETRYIDEISGRVFLTAKEAIDSEVKNGGIQKMFSFWKDEPEDKSCNFANGGWCYQRKESDYIKLLETIVEAVNMYEPWIAGQYGKYGGLKKEHVKGGTMMGRYLDDNNSSIMKWFYIQCCICPICFRQHGQPYHANYCLHNKEVREVGK